MPTVPGDPEFWLSQFRQAGLEPQEAAARSPAGTPKRKLGRPEAEFEKAVIDYAHLRGWQVVVIRKVRTVRPDGSVRWMTPFGADGKGFFDTVFVRERLVFAELKVRHNRSVKHRPEQKAWTERMRTAGQEVYLWEPKHWPQIEEVLK